MLDFIWEGLLAWLQTAILGMLDLINMDMLYAFSPQMITMEKYFPFLEETWVLITDAAFAMVLFLAIFKVFQNMFMVFTKNYEHPGIIVVRSILAFVLITIAPYLVLHLINFADVAYWGVLNAGEVVPVDGLFSGMNNMLGNMLTTGWESAGSLASETIDYSIFSPIDIVAYLPQAILSLFLTIAIAWNYFKLVLEIAERYIVLGVMYYTMPLAAVPIVSRETSAISKSWLKMLISELLILVLNVWFIVAFRKAVITSGATVAFTIRGQNVGSALLWTFIALAFLKIAQRIDSHISVLGLTTPQLGSGVGSTLLAGFATTGHMLSNATRRGGVFSPGRNSMISPMEQRATANLARSGKSGAVVTSARDINAIKTPADAMRAVKDNNVKMSGDAAAAYARKIAPEQLKNKDIISATADKNGFTAKYKDANGKEATLQFGEAKPDGISKQVSIAGADGYLKDTGTPYAFAESNDGKTTFNDFADQHLNGRDNFIAKSGLASPKDLENATVGANPDGEGLVLRDKDGHEIARISAFNDDNTDRLNANTVIGEGTDGLYRADFNSEPKIPLPEGYSYAGEKYVDANGNELPAGSEGGKWQDSYQKPDNSYISRDDMNDMLKDSCINNSDYAGNLSYSDASGFTDAGGAQVDLSKCGWEKATIASEQPLYDVDGTGTSYQSGEEAASHAGLNYDKGTFYNGYGNSVSSENLGWQRSNITGADGDAMYTSINDPAIMQTGKEIANSYSGLSYQDGNFITPSGEHVSPEALGMKEVRDSVPKMVDDGAGTPTQEYRNTITGGYATGSDIADRMSNPEYAGQAFGGHSYDGTGDLYMDGTKSAVFNQNSLNEGNAPKYGELPQGMSGYYNPSSGTFDGNDNQGTKNFGESIEALLDSDYTFSGKAGGSIAKTYMHMDGADVFSATIDKDNIIVEVHDKNLPDDMVRKEQYWSNLSSADKKSGTYQRVECAGDKSWVKTYNSTVKKNFNEESAPDISTRDHKYGSKSKGGHLGRRDK